MGKNYQVEKILDLRKKGNKIEYLVEWKPTWELSTKVHAYDLIEQFHKSRSDSTNNSRIIRQTDHSNKCIWIGVVIIGLIIGIIVGIHLNSFSIDSI